MVTRARPRSPVSLSAALRGVRANLSSPQASVGELGSEAKLRALSILLLGVNITVRRGGGGGVESIGPTARPGM